MHGLIFYELKKFSESKFGPSVWSKLFAEAGMAEKPYSPSLEYPDSDALALVGAASKLSGRPVPDLLQDFGEFIAPGLMYVYAPLLKPEWKTLDLIEHTEETIHKTVRIQNPGAHPPEIRCTRTSPTEVRVLYTSARKMCPLARGLVLGFAKKFGEKVSIDEPTCMLQGAPECDLRVKLVS